MKQIILASASCSVRRSWFPAPFQSGYARVFLECILGVRCCTRVGFRLARLRGAEHFSPPAAAFTRSVRRAPAHAGLCSPQLWSPLPQGERDAGPGLGWAPAGRGGGCRVSVWQGAPRRCSSRHAASSPLRAGSLPPPHQQSEGERNVLFVRHSE